MRIKINVCFFSLNNMEGTTQLDQLPTDNVYDPNQNIVMETKPLSDNEQGFKPVQPNQQIQNQNLQMPSIQQQPQQQYQMPPQAPQQQQQINPSRNTTPFPQMNQPTNNDPSLVQHINTLQTSNIMNNGAMDLPSRDIPTSLNHITQDPSVQPNHIPSGINSNYVNNTISQDMINDFSKKQNIIQSNNDFIFDELKIPLMISIIYYIFNQQFINNNIQTFFPSLFNNEQHLKKSGIIFKSLLFGVSYFSINKLITHFSKI